MNKLKAKMPRLKIHQEAAAGDYVEAEPYGSTMQLEVCEPWAGDTESGFGRGGTIQLTKTQAGELAEYLREWAES